MNNAGAVRIAVVNDYEVVVKGVASMLAPYSDRVEVVELDTEATPDRSVDVALFDTFGSSEADVLDRVVAIRAEHRADAVLLYTWHLAPVARRRLEAAGVRGIVSKTESAPRIVEAVERVAAGQVLGFDDTPDPVGLTEREREILELMAVGRTNLEIARSLFVSEETVKTYAKRLFRKLGVRNRVEASIRASQLGFAGR